MFTQNIEELELTGIYKITCNNKVYIGSAMSSKTKHKSKKGFYGRWRRHLSALNLNNHRNNHLQNAYNKYGKDSLNFEIIEIITDVELSKVREKYWINYYDSFNHNVGYNFIKNPLANYKIPNESTRNKISKALIGKPRPLFMKIKLGRPVVQFTLQMEKIAEFYSISEAAKVTGIARQLIGQACLGKYKTVGGFKWKKVKDIV